MRPVFSQFRFLIATLIVLLRSLRADAAPDDIEAAPAPARQVNQFFMNDANFEANLFQPSGNAKQARTQIESRLKLQLNDLDRICKLEEPQMQKLKLAASIDVKRFFDEVDALRKKFQNSKHDQNAWNNIWQEIHPLQMKLAAGLFGESSFFSKTIRKTLSDEQMEKYKQVVDERRHFRYRATIEVALTNLENSVPLRHTQHEALAKLLIDETLPPKVFGQQDQSVVMYYLARIPEDKIEPLLDERQWNLLKMQFNQFRGMEQFLIQNGLIIKDDDIGELTRGRVKKWNDAETPADATTPENDAKIPPPISDN